MNTNRSREAGLRKLQKAYLEGELEDHKKREYLNRDYHPEGDAASWQIPKLCITILTSLLASILVFILVQTSFNSLLFAGLSGFASLMGGLLVNKDFRLNLFRQQDMKDRILLEGLFKHSKYYFPKGNNDILLIEHDYKLTGVALIELRGIPHYIKGNFERFVKILHQQGIALFSLYMQTPIDKPGKDDLWTVRVFYGTRNTLSARIDIKAKREKLVQKLRVHILKIREAFHTTYPHTPLEFVCGQDLMRTYTMIAQGGAGAE